MQLPKGIEMKLIVNHPERVDTVRLVLDVDHELLREKKNFSRKLLPSLSPISVIVLVFKTCIEEMGYKVDIERLEGR